MTKTLGYQHSQFAKITVTATAFATTPDFRCLIRGGMTGFSLSLFSGASLQYSFNGTDVHGDLFATGGGGPAFVQFDNRAVDQIYFQVPSGTSVVRVECWRAC